MTDTIAERIRRAVGTTLRSIGHIARIQRNIDNGAKYVEPQDMLAELREGNVTLVALLQEAHEGVDDASDSASASPIENGIDEMEHRTWFLSDSCRR